ncbi:MAG: hypothetical protein KGN00_06330 [Chloroflexota bacterium]|nr:hypothetical protein [Chloroflexota bacterium]
MTVEVPIVYRCAAPGHEAPRPGADHHITLFRRQWAYCAYDSKSTGHDWVDTGGVPLASLEPAESRERSGVAG